MHTRNILKAGKDISEARKVLVLLHGRGGNAQDFISLAKNFPVEDFALYAPQATNNSWYPYSFLAPPSQNDPWLSSALEMLDDLLEELKNKGIASENIFFCGFSQGACLTAEFVTRYAQRFGGVILFTGGLIGDTIDAKYYEGDFAGTPVFMGTGNPDSHVPIERVRRTAELMKSLKAQVTVEVYENKPHSISPEEIEFAKKIIFY